MWVGEGWKGGELSISSPAAAIIIVSLAHAGQVGLCCRPTSLHIPRMFTKMCMRAFHHSRFVLSIEFCTRSLAKHIIVIEVLNIMENQISFFKHSS